MYLVGQPFDKTMSKENIEKVIPITKEEILLKMTEKIQYITELENIFMSKPILEIGIYEIPIRIAKDEVVQLIVEVVTNEYIKFIKDQDSKEKKAKQERMFDALEENELQIEEEETKSNEKG
jgi:hypothetical protein